MEEVNEKQLKTMKWNSKYLTRSTRQFSSQIIVAKLRFQWQTQHDESWLQNALESKLKIECIDDYDSGLPASHISRNEVLRNELLA